MEEVEIFVENLEDCYNPFDHDDISMELVEHIDLNVARTKSKNIRLRIMSKEEIPNVEKESLIDSIRAHYQLELYYNRYENRQLLINNMAILVIGVLFLLFKNHIPMGDTISDITDILGCFTIWTAVENILFTDYSQDSYLRVIKKVMNSTITFEVVEE